MNFKDQWEDIELEKAAKEFEEIEKEILEKEAQGNLVIVPKGLDKKMLQMIHEFERIELKKDKKKKFNKFTRLAAMIMICITVTFAVVTINVDAFHIKLFDFITKDNGVYMDVSIVEKGNISPSIKEKFPKEWDNVFYPMSLPEGYELVEVYNPGEIKGFSFSNKEKGDSYISFEYIPIYDGNTLMDSENADVGKTTVNGKQAIYSEKEGHVILMWVQNKYQFSVDMDDGNLKEAKNIAENIVFIKVK